LASTPFHPFLCCCVLIRCCWNVSVCNHYLVTGLYTTLLPP
jgi:hypothetical protein